MVTSYTTFEDLTACLRWQVDMGIDMALLDQPAPEATEFTSLSHIFNSSQVKTNINPPSLSSPAIAPAIAQIPVPLDDSLLAADLAKQANSLGELKKILQGFEGCELKKTASNLVFADGPEDASIMLIGEAPGMHEDRKGLPFIGPAGQFLNKMLASVEFDRKSVYITNIVPWRPPGNRTPSPEEMSMMLPFITRHIQLKAPKIIFALGASSAKLLLNSQAGILKLRGKSEKIDFSDKQDGSMIIPVLPTLHPAFLLKSPKMKGKAFEDLLALKKMSKQIMGN